MSRYLVGMVQTREGQEHPGFFDMDDVGSVVWKTPTQALVHTREANSAMVMDASFYGRFDEALDAVRELLLPTPKEENGSK